jgi:RNA polymerase sigma factor (sigma-70 family)
MEEKNLVSDRGTGDWELFQMLTRDIKKIPMLSREDEVDVARRAKAGNQAAADLLVESNLRFVLYVVFKHWYPGLPLMDMISEGCKGLINAAKLFDPEKGVRLTSYAFSAIANRIYDCISDHYHNKHASLDKPLDDEDETTWKDLLVADCPGADEIAANKQTHRTLVALNDRERRVIMLRYWLDLSQGEAAAKIGISRARIRQIENDALRKMRWSLTGGFSTDQQEAPTLAGVAGCEA